MLNSRRIFVDFIRKYCADREIAFQIKSDGWLLIMQKGAQRRFALVLFEAFALVFIVVARLMTRRAPRPSGATRTTHSNVTHVTQGVG